MPKRSSMPQDANQLAANIVAQTTGQTVPSGIVVSEKNQAAVELGRRGGLKGGRARANALSKSRRKQIAKQAALARWKKK